MDSKDSSKDELKNEELPEASPPKTIISKVGGWLNAVGEFLGWLCEMLWILVTLPFTLVLALLGGALYLILLALPIAIAIFIALWAYKTFLAD